MFANSTLNTVYVVNCSIISYLEVPIMNIIFQAKNIHTK